MYSLTPKICYLFFYIRVTKILRVRGRFQIRGYNCKRAVHRRSCCNKLFQVKSIEEQIFKLFFNSFQIGAKFEYFYTYIPLNPYHFVKNIIIAVPYSICIHVLIRQKKTKRYASWSDECNVFIRNQIMKVRVV
jgi:hypothetical protein